MMDIIHGLTLQSENSRLIYISYPSGCYNVAVDISHEVRDFKYMYIEGISFDDQFNDYFMEYKDYGFKIRIGHPISTELRNIISTMLNKDNTQVTFDFNLVRHKDDFKIVMHISRFVAIHDILKGLYLVQSPGITVDFIDHHDSREIAIKFGNLNDYNKLKLIGTIELITKHYPVHTIILPHSYMEFLEHTDKNNIGYIHSQ